MKPVSRLGRVQGNERPDPAFVHLHHRPMSHRYSRNYNAMKGVLEGFYSLTAYTCVCCLNCLPVILQEKWLGLQMTEGSMWASVNIGCGGVDKVGKRSSCEQATVLVEIRGKGTFCTKNRGFV